MGDVCQSIKVAPTIAASNLDKTCSWLATHRPTADKIWTLPSYMAMSFQLRPPRNSHAFLRMHHGPIRTTQNSSSFNAFNNNLIQAKICPSLRRAIVEATSVHCNITVTDTFSPAFASTRASDITKAIADQTSLGINHLLKGRVIKNHCSNLK